MPRGKPNSSGTGSKAGNKPGSSPSAEARGVKPGSGVKAPNGAGSGSSPGSETPERTEPGEQDELGGGLFTEPSEAFGIGPGGESGRDDSGTGPRPKRPYNRRGPYKKKAVQTSLEGIEAMLMSIHLMGSTLFHVPELVITQDEADQLGRAIARVAALYSFGISEHVMAWANLGVVMCGVYGTRAYAYHLRVKAETEKKKAPAPAPVISWPVVPQPAPAPVNA